MAPEQARGEVERVDTRSDVFSSGCLLCEILTGSPSYLGSGREVLKRAAKGDMCDVFARREDGGADPELVRPCQVSLAPAQDARPRDAGQLAEVVDAYLASVEERAHQAVLDAAAARQKRRLTRWSSPRPRSPR